MVPREEVVVVMIMVMVELAVAGAAGGPGARPGPLLMDAMSVCRLNGRIPSFSYFF
jgi:hypothetical protein